MRDIPAFPQADIVDGEGMTLLDWFAGKALQGDWAAQDSEIGVVPHDADDTFYEERAQLYYRQAKAMMKVREL